MYYIHSMTAVELMLSGREIIYGLAISAHRKSGLN